MRLNNSCSDSIDVRYEERKSGKLRLLIDCKKKIGQDEDYKYIYTDSMKFYNDPARLIQNKKKSKLTGMEWLFI